MPLGLDDDIVIFQGSSSCKSTLPLALTSHSCLPNCHDLQQAGFNIFEQGSATNSWVIFYLLLDVSVSWFLQRGVMVWWRTFLAAQTLPHAVRVLSWVKVSTEHPWHQPTPPDTPPPSCFAYRQQQVDAEQAWEPKGQQGHDEVELFPGWVQHLVDDVAGDEREKNPISPNQSSRFSYLSAHFTWQSSKYWDSRCDKLCYLMLKRSKSNTGHNFGGCYWGLKWHTENPFLYNNVFIIGVNPKLYCRLTIKDKYIELLCETFPEPQPTSVALCH